MGFEIIGVLPDADGFGKPDIFMAKRIKDCAAMRDFKHEKRLY